VNVAGRLRVGSARPAFPPPCLRANERNVRMVAHGSPMSVHEIDITGFSRVRVEGACAVEILRSDSWGIVVPNEDYSAIKFRKEGDTLVIGRKGIASILLFHARPRAVITMPELGGLALAGASQGKVLGFQSDRELSLDLSGASHLEMASMAAGDMRAKVCGASNLSGDIKASRKITFNINGASRVELTGSGDSARIDVSGASQARLAMFTLNSSEVNISGASSSNLRVNKKLNVAVSGASRLEYSGSPSLGRVSVSGASTFKQK
jgi:hypothetical protein